MMNSMNQGMGMGMNNSMNQGMGMNSMNQAMSMGTNGMNHGWQSGNMGADMAMSSQVGFPGLFGVPSIEGILGMVFALLIWGLFISGSVFLAKGIWDYLQVRKPSLNVAAETVEIKQ